MINVHLIAAKDNVINDAAALRKISDIIRGEGHNVIDDWVDHAYKLRVSKTDENGIADWASIYKTSLENIAKADVIIAETSYNTFGVGYQIAIAAQQKKPILLLRHEETKSDVFSTGIVDSWIKSSVYSDDNIQSLVEEFLKENDISTKDMRFNFFIDRQIYNYLRWSAFKTGKTKAEVLRDMIAREIDKSNQ